MVDMRGFFNGGRITFKYEILMADILGRKKASQHLQLALLHYIQHLQLTVLHYPVYYITEKYEI